jgi:hypothetical protein
LLFPLLIITNGYFDYTSSHQKAFWSKKPCIYGLHGILGAAKFVGLSVSTAKFSYLQHHPHVYDHPLHTIFCSVLFSLVGNVSGGGLVIGTQTPLESRTYPTGQLNDCPSALFKLKGGAVVNTAVNIVAANIAAIAILFWFITLYL